MYLISLDQSLDQVRNNILFEQGTVVIHKTQKPSLLEKKSEFDGMNVSEEEDWKIQKKAYDSKSDKVVNNLSQA